MTVANVTDKTFFLSTSALSLVKPSLTLFRLLFGAIGANVTLIARRELQCKEFDVPPEWMSHKRSWMLANFWQQPLTERSRVLQETRDGGSVPSCLLSRLRALAASDRIVLAENTDVISAAVQHPSGGDGSRQLRLSLCDATATFKRDHLAHMVFLATGFEAGVTGSTLLSQLQQQAPLDLVDDLPPLTETLQWRDDVPVHVMGGASALQLGPGALNLMGARAGAERVAAAVWQQGEHKPQL